MPTISIIIPLYKVSTISSRSFFIDLLQSIENSLVLSGSLHCLQEVLLINDSPEDRLGCEGVLCSIKKFEIFDKIRLFHNDQNIGQDASRNIGASKAVGDYLHFIDQDDLVSVGFYSNLIQLNLTDFVLFNILILIDGAKKVYYKPLLYSFYRRAKWIGQLLPLLIFNIAVSPGQYMIKREVFQLVKGFPVLKSKGCDDYGFLFNLCLLSRNRKITFSMRFEEAFVYRIHNTQNRKSLNMANSLREFFNSIVSSRNYYVKIIMCLKLSPLVKIVSLVLYKNVK